MEHSQDPLGILKLTKEIQKLKELLSEIKTQLKGDDWMPESRFMDVVDVRSAETLSNWRRDLTTCWKKKGGKIFWSPSRFFDEI